MKPSKEQFMSYLKVQKSGVTNMFAVDVVCALAGAGLTKANCIYIFGHYEELCTEYNITMEDI